MLDDERKMEKPEKPVPQMLDDQKGQNYINKDVLLWRTIFKNVWKSFIKIFLT